MARKDYPWHIPDFKFGNNLVVNVIILIFIAGYFAVVGIVSLIVMIVEHKGSSKSSKQGSYKSNNPSIVAKSTLTNSHRNWLVLVNDRSCDYVKCFEEHGYVYVNTKQREPNVSDIFYLYTSKGRRVRFKTIVIETNVIRQDEKYWRTTPPEGLTCKLQLISEYTGWALCASNLGLNGFNGEDSIQYPICYNQELLGYIEKHFNDFKNIIVKDNKGNTSVYDSDYIQSRLNDTSEQNAKRQDKKDKRWLIGVDENIYDINRAFDERACIYISTSNEYKFNSSDIVYIYLRKEGCVRFKTKVVETDTVRLDSQCWKVTPPDVPVYKLKLIDKYRGCYLFKSVLRVKGFKGNESVCDSLGLLDYIEEQFIKQTYMRSSSVLF